MNDDMRYSKVFDVELKDDAAASGKFSGHAAVFNNVDFQGDKIVDNAFTQTLKETGGRWPILLGHRGDKIIGFSTGAEQDAKGLLVHGELTLDSTAGRDAYATMKHASASGQKLGLSIGYRVRKNGADYDDATGIRLLKDVDVLEFSVVGVPANPRARVSRVKTVREAESTLRELGMSRDEAIEFISVVKSGAGCGTLDALPRDVTEAHKVAAAEFMSVMRMYEANYSIVRVS